MLRRITFAGLILSSLWLIFPLLPSNIAETKDSVENLSQAELNMEKKTLQKIEVDRGLSVETGDTSAIDISEGENSVKAQYELMEQSQSAYQNLIDTTTNKQKKIKYVTAFLSRWKGPAKYYSEEFVNASDTYGLDYRLLPSISIVESGGCKNNFKPHNCFGWGRKTFSSYEESIYTVAKGISDRYYSRGLVNPSQIGTVYAPGNHVWPAKVANLMSQMPKL